MALLTFSEKLAELGGNLKGFDITTILLYYAIGCLILLPFYVLFIIYLCKKKPQYIQKLNARLDKILGIETAEVKKEVKPDAEKKETESKDETPEKESKSIEEINEEMNVSNMVLRVADTYKCNITEWDRQYIEGNNYTWKSTDKFIASVDEMTGKLEAKKVGECFIECGGATFYFAKVLPTNPDWFAAKILRIVLGNMDKSNITANFISEKILDLNEESRIISYKGWLENMEKFSFEYNKRNEVIRALIVLKNAESTVNDICKNLGEYMSPVEFEKNSKITTKYWVHKSNNEGIESVDYNAFLKVGTNGDLYFGIGECWRIGADDQEIVTNPEMIDRSFKALLPASEVPAQLRTIAKISKPKAPKKNKTTSEEKQETSAENTAEETVGRTAEGGENSEEGTNENNGSDEENYDDYTPGDDNSYDEGSIVNNEEENPEDTGAPEPFDDYNEPGVDEDENSNN